MGLGPLVGARAVHVDVDFEEVSAHLGRFRFANVLEKYQSAQFYVTYYNINLTNCNEERGTRKRKCADTCRDTSST
jgi:hypothetical protein